MKTNIGFITWKTFILKPGFYDCIIPSFSMRSTALLLTEILNAQRQIRHIFNNRLLCQSHKCRMKKLSSSCVSKSLFFPAHRANARTEVSCCESSKCLFTVYWRDGIYREFIKFSTHTPENPFQRLSGWKMDTGFLWFSIGFIVSLHCAGKCRIRIAGAYRMEYKIIISMVMFKVATPQVGH